MSNRPKILITGGNGFIGANLVHLLLAEGYPVCVLIRASSNLFRLESVRSRIKFLACDLRIANEVRSAIESYKPNVVFHLASTSYNPPSTSAEEHFQSIALGTLNLINALTGKDVSRFVYISSAAVYGSGLEHDELTSPIRPDTMLGAAKASAEILVATHARLNKIPHISLRLFTPFGPWEDKHRLIPYTILTAQRGEDIRLTSGRQTRDFIFVGDVVKAMLLAGIHKLSESNVYNVGSGTACSVVEIVKTILLLMGSTANVRVGDLAGRVDEIQHMSGKINRMQQDYGWKPETTLEEGLKRSIEWFKRQENK